MTAKLIDSQRAHQFEVMVMPNLYGDILTDQAGQIQGGVGTAGSANLGKKYAMFEAIHGSAPRMVTEGRAQYADPCSMIKASGMLLQHIGYVDDAQKIQKALDKLTFNKTTVVIAHRLSTILNSDKIYVMEKGVVMDSGNHEELSLIHI